MLEADFYRKLPPTHPDTVAIVRDIRSEYDVPEIGSDYLLIVWGRRSESTSMEAKRPMPIEPESRMVELLAQHTPPKGLVELGDYMFEQSGRCGGVSA